MRFRGQQRSFGELRDFMTRLGALQRGEALVPDGLFPADRLIADGRERPACSGFLPGVSRHCHSNADFFQRAGEGAWITGLALSGGLWLSHSWIERAGQTIETTPIARERYVGFEVGSEEQLPGLHDVVN